MSGATALFVALYALGTGSPPAANESLDAEGKKALRKAVLHANSQVQDGDLLGGLASFQAAYNRFDHPLLLFNMAHVLTRLNRKPEAAARYDAYLRTPVVQKHASIRKRAKRELKTLSSRIARIWIADKKERAVFIDHHRLKVGEWVWLNPGDYVLKTKDGFEVALALRAGDAKNITLPSLDARPSAAPPPAAPKLAAQPHLPPQASPHPAEESGVSPWLWIILGAVAVGGATAGALALSGGDDSDIQDQSALSDWEVR